VHSITLFIQQLIKYVMLAYINVDCNFLTSITLMIAF